MNYGKLITARKSKAYTGKSSITQKALYRVSYQLYFYDENEKVLGYLSDNKPFTHNKAFNKKSEAINYLKVNGYKIIIEWEGR
jgi:hypothetical protein